MKDLPAKRSDLSVYIETFPDFPSPGVLFHDFTPLHADPEAFAVAISYLYEDTAPWGFNKMVAIEAKGFLIGSRLAGLAHVPLVLARKPGLTPGATIARDFIKEYGTGAYELKRSVLSPGDSVLIVYDILAGPGATNAVIEMIEELGASVAGAAFVIELEYLEGRTHLRTHNVTSLVKVPSP